MAKTPSNRVVNGTCNSLLILTCRPKQQSGQQSNAEETHEEHSGTSVHYDLEWSSQTELSGKYQIQPSRSNSAQNPSCQQWERQERQDLDANEWMEWRSQNRRQWMYPSENEFEVNQEREFCSRNDEFERICPNALQSNSPFVLAYNLDSLLSQNMPNLQSSSSSSYLHVLCQAESHARPNSRKSRTSQTSPSQTSRTKTKTRGTTSPKTQRNRG